MFFFSLRSSFSRAVYLYCVLAGLLWPAALGATTPFSATPKHEVRAVWLTTIKNLDWPKAHDEASQKRELRSILDQLQRGGINTVLLQTRIRATTIYPSAYEPFDVCLTGKPGKRPTYDPLQFAVEECHRRGMEIHAWLVSIPVGKWTELGCRELRKKHPDMVKRIADEGYLNPAYPQTAPYIAHIAEEIVARYDVDGINLDYIRYPETGQIGGGSASQKRSNITRIVRQVYSAVKQHKRWIKVSCSPIGKYSDLPRYSSRGWNACSAVYQDAQAWLKEGIMDQLYPMMYFRNDQFFPFAADWNEHSFGRMIVPGLGIYFLHPSEGRWSLGDITAQLRFLRREGMGFALFRSRFFTDDVKGIYSFICNRHAPYPALVPPMTWEHAVPPKAPQHLHIANTTATTGSMRQGVVLTWTDSNPRQRDGVAYTLYNIYASRQQPVDITDSRNLIACRIDARHLFVSARGGKSSAMYYAVTATDRFGNESPPAGISAPKAPQGRAMPLLVCNSRHLAIAQLHLDADVLQVEMSDMSGRTLRRFNIDARTENIDLGSITDGFYQLSVRRRAGTTRKWGFVVLKRQ